ncbi:MAG TPA: ABC transporter ATP-binding protein, partial [Pirellulales bacterium]|nr:ABC transporter ATP-binding protein [Pirellulales bacterium]
MNAPPLLVENLSFTFAGRATPTLREISFSIEPGSWTLLAGRSGSGKSTLLRAMAGLIPHHSAGQMQGDVLLFGRNTRLATPAELAGRAGLVLQSPDDQICTTTVGAEIAFGLENLALPADEIASRVRESLAGLGLGGRER